ncbi:MAG TPA: nuclear transport factor 2 family protein [Solirubrobacteraceae bacterium]|nr:nuclear transport factor 2 family protein [Solirubrobacteraceae bacterium]
MSSEQAIQNLVSLYAFLNDDADVGALGELFADAVFTLDGATTNGRTEIEAAARTMIQSNPDGTSTTSHTISNLIVEVDEDAGTAEARAYWTLSRSVPGLPLEPIRRGRYEDRFARRNGSWRFVERTATTTWSAG